MDWIEVVPAKTNIAVDPIEVSQWVEVSSARKDLSIQPGEISEWVEVSPARKDLSIQPGEISEWTEVKPVRQTLVVNPKGVPVCTPGEIKCVGYDLYTCSAEGQWQLTEKNSERCGYTPPPPPEEKFPWEYIAIAGGVILLVIAVVKK